MRGRCQCGAVVIEIDRVEPVGVACCCGICRRISGAAISHVVRAPSEAFRVVSGAGALAPFASSPNTLRNHCGTCHAPTHAVVTDKPELGVFVPAGIFEDPRALATVRFEPIFAEDLAAWHGVDWAGVVHAGAPDLAPSK